MAEGSRVRRIAEALLGVAIVVHAVVVVAVVVAMWLLGEHAPLTFFLLYLPRQPYAVAALVLLPLAMVAKKRMLVAVEIVTLLVALFPLMGLRLGSSRSAHATKIRLLTYNVFYAKLDADALTREITGADADVIVLQASRSSYAKRLLSSLPGWAMHVDDELVLATRWSIASVEVPPIEGEFRPSWVRYSIDGPAGAFDVVDVHPVSARSGLFDREDPSVATATRTRQIMGAVDAAARAPRPVLIAGDTNLPTLSGVARKAFSGYRDSFEEVGFGFGYTFPAKLPWMRIDRVLGGPRIRFLEHRVLPRGASDHRAVVVDFEISAP